MEGRSHHLFRTQDALFFSLLTTTTVSSISLTELLDEFLMTSPNTLVRGFLVPGSVTNPIYLPFMLCLILALNPGRTSF